MSLSKPLMSLRACGARLSQDKSIFTAVSSTASPRSVSTALKTSNGVKHVELMGDEGERPDPLTEEMFARR